MPAKKGSKRLVRPTKEDANSIHIYNVKIETVPKTSFFMADRRNLHFSNFQGLFPPSSPSPLSLVRGTMKSENVVWITGSGTVPWPLVCHNFMSHSSGIWGQRSLFSYSSLVFQPRKRDSGIEFRACCKSSFRCCGTYIPFGRGWGRGWRRKVPHFGKAESEPQNCPLIVICITKYRGCVVEEQVLFHILFLGPISLGVKKSETQMCDSVICPSFVTTQIA